MESIVPAAAAETAALEDDGVEEKQVMRNSTGTVSSWLMKPVPTGALRRASTLFSRPRDKRNAGLVMMSSKSAPILGLQSLRQHRSRRAAKANPFANLGELATHRIHARDPKTGSIMLVEVPTTATLQEALEDVAKELAVAADEIALVAEKKEDCARALARTPTRKLSNSSVDSQQPSRSPREKMAEGVGRGGRVRKYSVARWLTSSKRRFESAKSTRPEADGLSKGTRRMSFPVSMTLRSLTTVDAAWREDRKKQHPDEREAAMEAAGLDEVWSEGSLYFYRESHERSVLADQPMPWYDFLAHTELCRMNFDGLSLNEVEGVNVLARMLENLKVPGILRKSMDVISDFIFDVCDLMHDAPYHNFNHVVDVSQCLYVYLVGTRLASCVRPCELAGAFLAAVCHDLDHPGYSNVYVNNEGLAVSKRYDRESPLENHSVACFRRLCAKHDLLGNLAHDDRRRVDAMVEVMILRTDMKHHASLLDAVAEAEVGDGSSFLDDVGGIDLVLSLALKCADISNQARPWKVASRWNLAVYREFWREGDADARKKRKVNPVHVRPKTKGDIAKKSVGFIKFVVQPLYETYARCLQTLQDRRAADVSARVLDEALAVLATNLDHYQLEADGLHIPQDDLADRPGICGPQQLKMERCRFDRSKKKGLPRDGGQPRIATSTNVDLDWFYIGSLWLSTDDRPRHGEEPSAADAAAAADAATPAE